MMRTLLRAVTTTAVCSVAIAGPAPLHAQRADTLEVAPGAVLPLPALEVITSILPLAGPAIGSAVPARATVVSVRAIEAWEPRLLADALATFAGMSLYDDLGSPWKKTLVTRGFTASGVVGLPQGVSVFLDGVPVNEPDARQVNFDLLPLEHVQRVEVLSGTASLLGPNSLGGAINLVTRRGTPRGEGEVELSVGSWGAYAAEAALSGTSGGWGWYAGSGYERERGWRDFTGAEQYNGFVSADHRGETRGLRVTAYAARAFAETAGSLPESVYEIRPRANLTAGDFEDLTQVHFSTSGYATAGAAQIAFSLFARAHDAERFNVNQVHDPDVRSFSRNRTLGSTLDWRLRLGADGRSGFRAGAAATLNSADIRIFAERIEPGLTTHVQSPIRDAGVFVVGDYARGRIAASGGARLDVVQIPFRNRLDSARDTTSLYVQLNPRAGVTWIVGGGASLYASLGRSFRAPAVIELACADPTNPCPLPFALGDDPPLDPVTALTWELGGRWHRGRAAATASAYITRVRNDIFLFPYTDEDEPVGSTIDGYFANIEATRRAGIELDARLGTAAGHAAWFSYALTRATFEVDDIELFSIREEHGGGDNEVERGDRLPLVPAHTLRAGLDVDLTAGAELGLLARRTGRRWLRGDEANEEQPLPAHTLFDARLGLERGAWQVQLVVRNVLDTRYAAFGTFNVHQAAGGVLEQFLTPGEPRSLRLVVRRSFGSHAAARQ